MMRFLVLMCVFWGAVAQAEDVVVRDDLGAVFAQHSAKGAFVMLDVSADRRVVVNEERAARRLPPASTFKIANSLIALETGVVADENEIIPHDGKSHWIKAWEKDMSMREAIKVSNLPVYQKLAQRVGIARYKEWLARLQYGNEKVGKNVERFWLGAPLEITAHEQVQFVAKLAQGKLDASRKSQRVVRDIMRIESRGDAVLFAKTGWSTARKPGVGWYVGWVEKGDDIYAFALNMDMDKFAEAGKRKVIATEILKTLGVW